MSVEVESAPIAVGNSVENKESNDAAIEAIKLLSQGKRNLLCGEIPTAVNQLQEASAMLAATFGETAKECGESYFYYGQSLLELARMETGVLGNALQGVPEEDTEDDAEPSEQFESAEKVTGEEREKIRDEVYDAMSEDAKSQADGNADTKAEGSEEKKTEVETEENKENVENDVKDKTETVGKKPLETNSEGGIKKEEDKLADKTAEMNKQNEQISENAEKDLDKKPDSEKIVNGNSEDVKEEVKKDGEDGKKNSDEIQKDSEGSKKDADSNTGKESVAETEKSETKEKEANSEENVKKENVENADEEQMEVATECKEEEKEGDDAEGEGEDGETEEEEEGATEEGEDNADPGEGTSSGPKEEDPDDISNLQLSWEMLELAKVIYLKQDDKEMKLKAAQAYLKLGEVSLETEQYDQAISDIGECLKIQKEQLAEDDRLLAETQYQLGLAYSFNKNFDEAIDSFRGAIKVIEDRMGKLKQIVKGAKKDETAKESSDKAEESKDGEKTDKNAEGEKADKSEEKDKVEEKTSEKSEEKDVCSEEKEAPVDPIKAAQKEIEDLGEILPDIRSKIEDVVEERKNMDVLKTMAKDVFTSTLNTEAETIGTKPVSSENGVQASDISHLIRKKRKPESDVEEEAETKKSKQENGSGDAPPATNGVHEEEKTKEPVKDVPMATEEKAEAVST